MTGRRDPITGTNPPSAGQIGLVHSHDFFAKVVSWCEGGSPVTHCVIALGDGYCIGAEPLGARIRNINELSDVVWSAFALTPEQREHICSTARSLSGRPYAYLGDLWIGIALILRERKLPQWIKRRLAGNYRLQCAQLADLVYRDAGIALFSDHREPGAVYPASYVPEFRKRGWLAS